MSYFLQNGLANRPVFSLAGNKDLILIKSSAILSISTNLEEELVEEVNLQFGEKYNLFEDLDNLFYVLTPEISKNGTLYGIEIGFTVPIQTTAKNSLFNTLRNTDVTAIVRDRNNRWWLCGLKQPLKLTTQEQKIDESTNQYSIKLTGKQRDNVKEMSGVWIIALTENQFSDMVDSVDGANLDITFVSATNNGGSNPPAPVQLPNNFQNTITAPPTNYVIGQTIGVVFATPGTTIKLPATAVNGQQHTVKDYVGVASSVSITVSGNGKLIDGNAEAKVNTDYGSITFTYLNNNWLTTGFVN
jgi:hypothetical protein